MKRICLLCALFSWACDEADTVESRPDLAGADMAIVPDAGPDEGAATDLAGPDAAADATDPDAANDGALADASPADDGVDAGADLDAAADLGEADLDPVDAGPDGAEPDAPPPPPNIDIMIDFSCREVAYVPGECVDGEGVMQEAVPAAHVPLPEVIEYAESPPATGSHRPSWGRWGEYQFMPPQRWLHNLEHGGIALLYHPCAPAETIDAMRELARARADDDEGPFRWVLTPYPDLPSAVAVVAWGWVYSAECVDEVLITDFIDRFYRMGPEDVRSDGRYDELWIGR